MNPAFAKVAGKYDLIETTVEVAPGRKFDLVHVADINALVDGMDAEDFGADERLPYWATLWPSAIGLAGHLVEAALPNDGPALELGAGLGLVSVAAASRGLEVTTADYEEDALAFAARNAELNGVHLATKLLDFRAKERIGAFPLVLASDVLYEARNVSPLAAAIQRNLAPGGTALVADPRRPHLGRFVETLEARGFAVACSARGDIAIIHATRQRSSKGAPI